MDDIRTGARIVNAAIENLVGRNNLGADIDDWRAHSPQSGYPKRTGVKTTECRSGNERPVGQPVFIAER